MPGLEIHPLSDLRDEAATLLAERFARQRAAEPLLPDVEDVEPYVPDEDGVVATRSGAAVAFLAGTDGRVGFAGAAAREAEALRDLFAVLAARWETRRFEVAVPASETETVDAFFRLMFGCQSVWAVRETAPEEPADFGGSIRLGTADDFEAAVQFDEILMTLQARAPSFSELKVPPRSELRDEWRDTWENDDFVHFVAERDGRTVGHALLYRRPEGDLRVPEANIDLGHAVTLDDVRGSGVGLALTAHVLRFAHDRGYRSLTTDWRSANLLSSRFWPRRGFRPQYLRLARWVP